MDGPERGTEAPGRASDLERTTVERTTVCDDGIRTRDPNLGNVKKSHSDQGIYATALVK